MNKYIKNYILSVLNTVMMLLFPIITFPYVSRVLGPEKLGIINFAQSYGYYFTHIASFGINSYALREVSKVRDNREKVEKLSCEVFNLNLFFSVFGTALYFVGMLFSDNFKENFAVFSIYSIVILTNFLNLDWLLQSFDDYFFSTIRNLVIRTISVIAVFAFIKKADDYILYMFISCISEMGTKFSTLLYCRKNYSKLSVGLKYLNFNSHIKSMFTLFSFRLVNGISANLDKLMIGFMLTYASVGIYSAGVKFALMISSIVETVGIVLFPKINVSAELSKDEYKKNLEFNYNAILLIGIPMMVGLCIISEQLIPLFAGGEYKGAVSIARIMSSIIVLGPIGDMLGSKTLLVHKKDRWLLYSSGIVAISNIVLNAIFIPLLGSVGAAIASVICYIESIIVRGYFSSKLVRIKLINRTLFKYLLFTLPFVCIYLLFKIRIDTQISTMMVFVLACVLIYIGELLLTRDTLALSIVEKLKKN